MLFYRVPEQAPVTASGPVVVWERVDDGAETPVIGLKTMARLGIQFARFVFVLVRRGLDIVSTEKSIALAIDVNARLIIGPRRPTNGSAVMRLSWIGREQHVTLFTDCDVQLPPRGQALPSDAREADEEQCCLLSNVRSVDRVVSNLEILG